MSGDYGYIEDRSPASVTFVITRDREGKIIMLRVCSETPTQPIMAPDDANPLFAERSGKQYFNCPPAQVNKKLGMWYEVDCDSCIISAEDSSIIWLVSLLFSAQDQVRVMQLLADPNTTGAHTVDVDLVFEDNMKKLIGWLHMTGPAIMRTL